MANLEESVETPYYSGYDGAASSEEFDSSSQNLAPEQHSGKVFFRQSDYEILQDWHDWSETYEGTVRIPPFVGAVGTFLLKELASFAAQKILGALYNKLFPSGNEALLMEILRATEALIEERLEQDAVQRVQQELVGLQSNVKTFLEDVEDFETHHAGSSPDDSEQPLEIIDSVHTLNQLFMNRMPQFRIPRWKVQLLPLFAQAANLHLLFIRDVLLNAEKWGLNPAQIETYRTRMKDFTKEYSNYAITTYKEEFERNFSGIPVQRKVEFRNYMVQSVLDYVSMWSVLRFKGLVINSSACVYNFNYSSNSGFNHRLSISAWPVLNRLFQGPTNNTLWWARVYNTIASNPMFYGHNVRGIYVGQIGNMETGPVGSTRGRPLKAPIVAEELGEQTQADYIDEYWHTKYLNSHSSPICRVDFQAFSYTGGSKTRMVDGYQLRAEDNTSYRFIAETTGGAVHYPGWRVLHISGMSVEANYNSLPAIKLGTWQNFPVPGDIGTLVTTFRRTIISEMGTETGNGWIRHVVPVDDDGKPLGFAISPLQFHAILKTYGEVSEEQHANFGDAVLLAGDNVTTRWVDYEIKNRTSSSVTYDIYLKVAVQSGTATLGFSWNSGGRGMDISADTHEGIADNNYRGQFVRTFTGVELKPNETAIFGILQSGKPVLIQNILFVRSDTELVYPFETVEMAETEAAARSFDTLRSKVADQ
ncbi:insecticidal delta-endotoxin Cry8Ea1 family protein [Nocardia sp. CA-107356]|uniref:insecticidal delta-endotoxin Cry8Ea1 family protein n=1 Tax=Nocardia sp. CA-107356 TaxID=3239972 RepID=UPI003D9467C4